MDLELVLTTILAWMKYRVEDAAPWVQWAGAVYALYLFVRGNWTVLRDLARTLCWTGQKTGVTAALAWGLDKTRLPAILAAANAWRKRPSRYAKLEARLDRLLAELGDEPSTKDPLATNDAGLPPVVTACNKAELEAQIEAALTKAHEQKKAGPARNLREPVLDGGTSRKPSQPIYVGTQPLHHQSPQ